MIFVFLIVQVIQQVAAPHSERFEAIEEDEEVSAGIVFDSPVGRKMPLASLLQGSVHSFRWVCSFLLNSST